MNQKTLENIFGTNQTEAILEKKRGPQNHGNGLERAIPAKISRVKLSADECQRLCKAVGFVYQEGYEERVFQFTLTDETVDRYGDVIKAKGGNLKNYVKNPVVLGFHESRALPVGISIRTFYDAGANDIKGWVLLYGNSVDVADKGFAETLYNYIRTGAMKTGSIGFMPNEGGIVYPSDDERALLGMPKYGIIYSGWELLEFSLVPVPANPSATMKSAFERAERGEQVEPVEEIEITELDAICAQLEFDLIARELEAEQTPEAPETPETPETPTPEVAPPAPEAEKSMTLTISPALEQKLDALIGVNTLLLEKYDRFIEAVERALTPSKLSPPDGAADEFEDGDIEAKLYGDELDELAKDLEQRLKV